MKPLMRHRMGFTLVEVSVACVLTAVLAVMLSATWRLLMPSTTDLIVWGQLFQEMQIAVTTLSRDCGGALPDNVYRGPQQQGLLLGCRKTTDGHLQLCFDGVYLPAESSPSHRADGQATWNSLDTVIEYYVASDSHTLMRLSNQSPTTPTTVAGNVESMAIDDSAADTVTITLTFAHHFPHPADKPPDSWKPPLTRSCTLVVRKTP
jgi:type II secretory pathway component PulJ